MAKCSSEGPESTITFSVEMEFLAALKASAFCYIPQISITHLLRDRLGRFPLQGPEETGGAITAVANSKDYSVIGKGVDRVCWTVAAGSDIEPEHPEWFTHYEVQPIKIISPLYRIHSSRWQNEIERIFSSRPGQYNPILASDIRLYWEINSGTSLRVYVGNGIEGATTFSFRTVRNLAMILLVYEPELDKMISSHEHASPSNQRERSVSSSQSPYFLPPNLPPQVPRTALACHLLNTCSTMRSVILAMNPPLSSSADSSYHTCFKYNFSSLLDPLNDHQKPGQLPDNSRSNCKSPVIEFRQGRGTLDPALMAHWIRFLGALVSFAQEVSLESLIEFLGIEKRNDGTGYRVIEERSVKRIFLDGSQQMVPSQQPLPHTRFAVSLAGTGAMGSPLRLLDTLKSAKILLDPDTYGFWRLKFLV